MTTLEAALAPPTALAHEEAALFAPTYPLPRLELTHGRGARVWDALGREYLDFTCGIAVNAFGHAPGGLARVVARQIRTLGHVSNLYAHRPGIELARALTDATGYARAFFCNSGTEAVEAALKFARVRARARGLPGRDVLAFHGGFHGRTAWALAATATPGYREPFAPLVPGVRFAPFNDLAALDRAFDGSIAAAIVEPVQGEGGAIPATPGFLHALRARCDAGGAALILDEVQSGMGRCGRVLASEHFGVRGDYVAMSKALGGGLPLGAVLMDADAASSLAPGMHGCTFGGGPVQAAAGLWALARVRRPAFLAGVRRRGRALLDGLARLAAAHSAVGRARGLGLLCALELEPDAGFDPPALIAACRERGLLLVRGGERGVRVLPPLDVTGADLELALGRLDAALTALAARARETAGPEDAPRDAAAHGAVAPAAALAAPDPSSGGAE